MCCISARLNLSHGPSIPDYLVVDDVVLAHIAFERGTLERLATLVQSITPLDLNEQEDEEPESISALREVRLDLDFEYDS